MLEIQENLYFTSPDNIDIDYYDDLNRIEKESEISILSDKELNTLAIKNDKVVGALYTGMTGNKYSFDIIVDKNFRNQGIGDKLFKFGMEEFKQLPDGYVLRLDVVNPHWVEHHKKYGLKILKKIGNHTIMTI